jgi:hypothetical protein
VAVDEQSFERAARLFAATERLCETTGLALEAWLDAAQQTGVEAAREHLGAAAFQSAWEAGSAAPWDDIVREVLDSGT